MNRIAGIAILIVGLLLQGWGLNASNSVGSGISRSFTGARTDRSIVKIVGGIVLAADGAGTAFYP
ncbi:MAG TPA: DUF3185 family protein [Planctomycetota bacterium]|nr:DUF3185 family protein [Planctomycetota bacterium]